MRLSAHTLLVAWESGRKRHPVDRALMFRALSAPEEDPDRLADEPLGQCNAALLRLCQHTFGTRMLAYVDCPRCAQRLELELDPAKLLAALPAGAPSPVEIDGLRFRPPCSRDLAAIRAEADVDVAAQRLLSRCRLDAESSENVPEGGPALERVEAALERADPGSDVTLEVGCDGCDEAWAAPFDVGSFLWEEVDARARRLLDDVHLLARAYGWSEEKILALSEERRGAYLERLTA